MNVFILNIFKCRLLLSYTPTTEQRDQIFGLNIAKLYQK